MKSQDIVVLVKLLSYHKRKVTWTQTSLAEVEFANKIDVRQANLSNMENGRRPIGKNIAKRIEKIFGTNYRYFLE